MLLVCTMCELYDASYFPFVVYFLGFRMASACAHNALLQKVTDNGADSGIHNILLFAFKIYQFAFFCCLYLFAYYVLRIFVKFID